MGEVGIRELRDHLSRYIDRVRGGEELVVTERGTAVARILPIEQPRPYDRLVADGLIQPASVEKRSRPRRRVKVDAPVSELVAEQRR